MHTRARADTQYYVDAYVIACDIPSLQGARHLEWGPSTYVGCNLFNNTPGQAHLCRPLNELRAEWARAGFDARDGRPVVL